MCRVGAIAEVTRWNPAEIIKEYDDQIDELAPICQAMLIERKERQAQAASRS